MRWPAAVVCLLALVAGLVGCGARGEALRRGPLPRPKLVVGAPPVRPIGARLQARLPTGVIAVCSIVAADGRLWLSAPWERELLAIDPRRDRVIARIHMPGMGCLMRSEGGLLWVDLSSANLLVALDPATGRVVRHVRTEGTCGYGFDFAAGSLWIGENFPVHTVTRRDPRTGATLATAPRIGESYWEPCGVTAAGGWIWVGTADGLYRVDPHHLRAGISRVDAGGDPESTLVAAGDQLWVGDDGFEGLYQLDARSGRTIATYRFGGGAVTVGGGRVWTTGSGWAETSAGRRPILDEIDPRSERVVARYRLGRRDPGFVGERHHAGTGPGLPTERVLSGAALAYGSLWIHQNAERRLYRIDPRP